MQWHERLREERIRRNWRQHDLAEQLGASRLTVQRWERGSHLPSAYFRLKLTTLFEKDAQELGFLPDEYPSPVQRETNDDEMNTDFPSTNSVISSSSLDLWTVPYPRNPFFTGRQQILQTLYTQLAMYSPVAGTRALALCGPGGIGKTEVALEYAYRYAHEYQAVFWLAAESSESLVTSMQQIADVLLLEERHAPDQSQMMTAVRHWLATHMGWLLIADNVEDLDQFQWMLPARRPGALLMTMRHLALGALAAPLKLPPMTQQEGVSFLLHRARQHEKPGTYMCPRSETSARCSKEASALVEQLEGFPLALDQAGAYLEETGCHVVDYLERYQSQRKDLLGYRGKHGGAHPASVTATILLSVAWTERDYPAAADLLRICAFLPPKDIPEELLRAGAAHLGPTLSPIVTNPYQFDLILAALRNASLITRVPEKHTLSIHRLVQAVLQDHMGVSDVRLWGGRVIRMINAALTETGIQGEWLLEQALACVPMITRVVDEVPEAGELLTRQEATCGHVDGLRRRNHSWPRQWARENATLDQSTICKSLA